MIEDLRFRFKLIIEKRKQESTDDDTEASNDGGNKKRKVKDTEMSANLWRINQNEKRSKQKKSEDLFFEVSYEGLNY
jgi:hypothetical protein